MYSRHSVPPFRRRSQAWDRGLHALLLIYVVHGASLQSLRPMQQEGT